ncbi:OmpA/MotB [Novosphingobium aromaticivorans DSM 12444]|uniref:Peptidoglycan-associated lipoprotein n=1 Tax=Novosphingobium aromaticivorans (strain ATCC 700278 / DSM 12444 / CCUG 56034 / CIP 105152 / NBRC 16084 / F199) TaxID=279238 RepID=Q2GBD7_NOVAD|nr:peptidoglycan-associated lipoprotein Pal [Novosphingobium aromaticivorans]ABD24836.1 OmpA/MotB [Novosphingobium aromaticivorans DSM 12444]SCY16112.1 peptidoglycan-associated lipoprotein [Novosphingobium aromaticivorans]
MKRTLALALLASGALALSACGQKRAPESLPPEPGPQAPVAANNGDYDANGNYIGPGSQADLRRTAGSDRVFFDFDSYGLDDTDRATLTRQASWLAQYPNVNVTIEGHADERGTRDYNLALGERRANAAKNFLASLGVATTRMSVVSYGKERPEALGSDEQSWAQNRRAVTMVIR